MAVILPNATLGVRRRAEPARDAHGEPLPQTWAAADGSWPGRAAEQGDGTWALALDVAAWPVRRGDLVTDTDTGQEWLVDVSAVHRNSADPALDHVTVTGRERAAGGTEPGGVDFTGRPG